MPDANVKVTSQSEPNRDDRETSSCLLRVEVLDDLKHAIRDARITQSLAPTAQQK